MTTKTRKAIGIGGFLLAALSIALVVGAASAAAAPGATTTQTGSSSSPVQAFSVVSPAHPEQPVNAGTVESISGQNGTLPGSGLASGDAGTGNASWLVSPAVPMPPPAGSS
jgi:hypothetical protein